jgi:toxin ParE1/3/4
VGTYSFTKAAIQDLESICDAIAIDNADAASNLFDDIRKQCVRVAKFPLSGKSYDMLKPNLRGFIIKNYIVFYTIDSENITIVKIVSGYRDLEAIFRSK